MLELVVLATEALTILRSQILNVTRHAQEHGIKMKRVVVDIATLFTVSIMLLILRFIPIGFVLTLKA